MTHAVNLDAVGRTALVTAAMRAAETSRPDAIHRDPYAAALAGDLGRQLLAELLAAVSEAGPSGARTGRTPGATAAGSGRRAVNAIRTRFFDDYLRAAVTEAGLRQVVVAGAGMDSRAYRMQWPDGVRYFEVDRPPVLDYKRECLAAESPRADHRWVPVDLAEPSWPEALADAGFDPALPSTWLLEGLLFYLPESAVHRVLGQIAESAAPGSRIAADLVNAAALTMPAQRALLEVFASWGCPWLFGCDEPEELFARHGFAADVVQPGEPGADFGRWPDPVPPRDLPDLYRVFLVSGRRH
ncbi:SAM-dependent methyltransferase [Actinacidiphila bryophytorum]|uniref:S-adenosyl-L-methionine-dependent methyltransferase n=1 Tax=Actinacidiphila bryophytorum TaxID=1436133 RepID=A0A9W4E5U9_9ACTN|nr:SAM-dependent methyltransferase [Actinacidiphila bryophytorum]MBM9437967.1 SAM-dependent methyltransferase [Actinacidiphila bryophytorum]MBN6542660.1 SAM-dependent methyltransferase [Actinacidiphila bryophytorum]CAG7617461.1 S-adenosyl-L-methionine-dependent methyltransferase [Actinacidiphila bryophytorum]